ncbi:hypothetical protein TNCV_1682461 [Trichonephila clavipes]|nr:hypothetical protein TNCV_1682461 [Trichonephila clavipes]
MVLKIRLDLSLNVRKNYLCPTALCTITVETINTRYTPDEWLHIYTDGSLLDFTQGAGVFCDIFSFYTHVGCHMTDYDGEIKAIHLALHQLSACLSGCNFIRIKFCPSGLGK